MKEEYHTTRFLTEAPDGPLPNPFFIVTAHNPFGTNVSPEENHANNARLLRHLKESRWLAFPVTGQCEDHAEAGFGIACTRAEAIALGQDFCQDAIYQVRDDQVTLVDCKEEEGDEFVGLWSQLQDHSS